MNVFISWSGERSRLVAELLSDWLIGVIQRLKPWIAMDMDRGSIWFSDLSEALSDSSDGIICITKENMNNPWILFESGALAKGLATNRVCSFLVDLKVEDLSGPLNNFNATTPAKDSVFSLVRTLNKRLDKEALPDKVLHEIFILHWPLFEMKFSEIMSTTKEGNIPEKTDAVVLSDISDSLKRLERQIASSNIKSIMLDDISPVTVAHDLTHLYWNKTFKSKYYADKFNDYSTFASNLEHFIKSMDYEQLSQYITYLKDLEDKKRDNNETPSEN